MSFRNGRATIANIALDPDFQGRGAGRQLMHFAESRALKKNYSSIHLATHSLLTENLSLYKHLGWVEEGQDGERVFMRKNLDGKGNTRSNPRK